MTDGHAVTDHVIDDPALSAQDMAHCADANSELVMRLGSAVSDECARHVEQLARQVAAHAPSATLLCTFAVDRINAELGMLAVRAARQWGGMHTVLDVVADDVFAGGDGFGAMGRAIGAMTAARRREVVDASMALLTTVSAEDLLK